MLVLPVPEIAISPSGNVIVTAGGSFIFNCIVTVKIPPLPIEVLINGNVDQGSRVTTNAPRTTSPPFDSEEYLFDSVSIADNGTAIECRAFVSTTTEVITIISEQIQLIVPGSYTLI